MTLSHSKLLRIGVFSHLAFIMVKTVCVSFMLLFAFDAVVCNARVNIL